VLLRWVAFCGCSSVFANGRATVLQAAMVLRDCVVETVEIGVVCRPSVCMIYETDWRQLVYDRVTET
jgi:hypothetical protein